MAIKTMSAASGGGGKFSEGWHECTVKKAEYGTYKRNDGTSKQYIDVWFEDYPDNHNLRVYEATNKTTNEEFKLANVFKFANAGIVGVLKDPNGKHPLIQYDDDPKGLVGKVINTFLYKETKTGNNYTRIFDDIAPVVQEGEHLSYTETDVTSIKKGIEDRCSRLNAVTQATEATATAGTDDDMPY